MELDTSLTERVIHLALFVSAGVASGVAAIALLERVSTGGRRAVRGVHVAVAWGAVLLLFGVERIYHLV